MENEKTKDATPTQEQTPKPQISEWHPFNLDYNTESTTEYKEKFTDSWVDETTKIPQQLLCDPLNNSEKDSNSFNSEAYASLPESVDHLSLPDKSLPRRHRHININFQEHEFKRRDPLNLRNKIINDNDNENENENDETYRAQIIYNPTERINKTTASKALPIATRNLANLTFEKIQSRGQRQGHKLHDRSGTTLTLTLQKTPENIDVNVNSTAIPNTDLDAENNIEIGIDNKIEKKNETLSFQQSQKNFAKNNDNDNVIDDDDDDDDDFDNDTDDDFTVQYNYNSSTQNKIKANRKEVKGFLKTVQNYQSTQNRNQRKRKSELKSRTRRERNLSVNTNTRANLISKALDPRIKTSTSQRSKSKSPALEANRFSSTKPKSNLSKYPQFPPKYSSTFGSKQRQQQQQNQQQKLMQKRSYFNDKGSNRKTPPPTRNLTMVRLPRQKLKPALPEEAKGKGILKKPKQGAVNELINIVLGKKGNKKFQLSTPDPDSNLAANNSTITLQKYLSSSGQFKSNSKINKSKSSLGRPLSTAQTKSRILKPKSRPKLSTVSKSRPNVAPAPAPASAPHPTPTPGPIHMKAPSKLLPKSAPLLLPYERQLKTLKMKSHDNDNNAEKIKNDVIRLTKQLFYYKNKAKEAYFDASGNRSADGSDDQMISPAGPEIISNERESPRNYYGKLPAHMRLQDRFKMLQGQSQSQKEKVKAIDKLNDDHRKPNVPDPELDVYLKHLNSAHLQEKHDHEGFEEASGGHNLESSEMPSKGQEDRGDNISDADLQQQQQEDLQDEYERRLKMQRKTHTLQTMTSETSFPELKSFVRKAKPSLAQNSRLDWKNKPSPKVLYFESKILPNRPVLVPRVRAPLHPAEVKLKQLYEDNEPVDIWGGKHRLFAHHILDWDGDSQKSVKMTGNGEDLELMARDSMSIRLHDDNWEEVKSTKVPFKSESKSESKISKIGATLPNRFPKSIVSSVSRILKQIRGKS